MAGAAAPYKAMFPDATPDKVMAEVVAISLQPDIPFDGGPIEYFTG
jgi:hypothetical protein